jgi:NAD(P)-dependent dehydrogenase (short-subunit alcohol dehydrogenase family)
MGSLSTKIALITGASDIRGIGFACAKSMADKGASIALTDLPSRKNELEQAVTVLAAQGAKVRGYQLDITDEQQVEDVVSQIKEDMGPVNVLVNNAGSGLGAKPLMKTTTKDWTISWQVNVLGTVNCCKAVIPDMKETGGVIINNASTQGLRALPAYGAYVTHKHAVIGLTRTLAAELGVHNIRVVAICPGVIDTAMNDHQLKKLAIDAGTDIEHIKSSMSQSIALRRTGMPEDIGKVAAFLASDDADYMTGNAVEINGGIMVGLS